MPDPVAPIVIDLGKKSRKQIKDLKRGQGKLKIEVLDTASEVKQRLGAQADGKELVPIVVVYSRKKRTAKGLKVPMLF
jgi:hypothetical protein